MTFVVKTEVKAEWAGTQVECQDRFNKLEGVQVGRCPSMRDPEKTRGGLKLFGVRFRPWMLSAGH